MIKNSIIRHTTGGVNSATILARKYIFSLKAALFSLIALLGMVQARAQGTWTPIAASAPHYNAGVMLLLSDGSVLCKTSSGGSGTGTTWDKLTPTSTGSYVNGTWSTIAPMHNERLYFSSQVMKDGRVYVAGGEYGDGGYKSEVYDPQTNVWTACPPVRPGPYTIDISDANSEILPDGRILQAVVDTAGTRLNYIYNPTTNTYSSTASCLRTDNEASWVKLPDQSILFIDNYGVTSERYIPATHTWINDGTVPVSLYDLYGSEAGAAFLLPDGRVFFIGATNNTAYYTPSGTTAPGTWSAGPVIPSTQGAPDAAAAMMANGKILMAVSPVPRDENHFPDSLAFYEFDYTTNTFTLVPSPYGDVLVSGSPAYITNMLCLPDGSVMYAAQGGDDYYVYTSAGSPLAAGKPIVENIIQTSCSDFTVTGKLFNGIGEGAAYGDDWQMSTNYPIVRITSGTNVYYARSYNWNRTDVMTGAAPDTASFTIPAAVTTGGTYTLQVIANGNASVPHTFTPGPVAIAPATVSMCAGGNVTLTDASTGGLWSSSNAAVATAGSSTGIITGVAAGTATITYALGTCTATRVVTVLATPSAITGSALVCAGTTTSYTDAVGGGIWSSSSPVVLSLTSLGIATGISSGTATITYAIGSCSTNRTVTVSPAPAAITGTTTVCLGATSTLTDATPGGTWSSSDATIAVVGISTGVVSGLATGTATISYNTASGCGSSVTVTVNGVPAITGPGAVCLGITITLADATAGGVWITSNIIIAPVTATGVVTGHAAGVANITYMLGGCSVYKTVTVTTAPAAITGNSAFCAGNTIALANSAGGGTWSSSNAAVATVNATTGLTSGVSAGTATITYTTACGSTSVAVTVNAAPAPVTGPSSLCLGTPIALSTATPGGTWSSSNINVSVGISTGIVTGISNGAATITYRMPGGCYVTKAITVSAPANPIVGPTALCTGTTRVYTNDSAGTWSVSDASIASITAATGVVTALASGVTTITFTLASGCYTTLAVTVNAAPASIAGPGTVCTGSTIALTDVSVGGTWTSTSPIIASADISGMVTGNSAGTAIISYTLPTGCAAYKTVTVTIGAAAITGPSTICLSVPATFTDAIPGGTWSSSIPFILSLSSAGVATGVSAGTATITYTAGGCSVYKTVTVSLPPTAITGSGTVCTGATITLGDAVTGGTWISGNTAIATAGSSTGIVTGLAAGVVNIYYSTAAGCSVSKTITVNPNPGAITGPSSVCSGTTILLSSITTGGVWTSSTPAVATIGAGTGIVTAVSFGTTTITYMLPTGCMVTKTITAGSLGTAISGPASVCVGQTAIFTTDSAGTWSASGAAATIGATTGVLSGIATGVTTITFTSTNGCTATKIVNIMAAPAAIAGPSSLCVSFTASFTDATPGGTWSVSNPAIATINAATGSLSTISAGVVTISYSLGTGCITTRSLTVNPAPAPITGSTELCSGATVSYHDALLGGVWASSNSSVVTIDGASGIAIGLTPGTANIYYSIGTCGYGITVTVNPAPAAITGPSSMCIGFTSSFADATPGGTWSVSNPAIATINAATGSLTTLSAGIVTITYSSFTGCTTTRSLTVNPAPAPITGSTVLCEGTTVAYTDALPGGTWASSNSSVVAIDSASGIAIGVTVGTANIYYSIGTCGYGMTVTVNPAPAAITGPLSMCVGITSSFTDATPGGTWSVSNPAIATINAATGSIITLSAGIVTITYSLFTGCITTRTLTVSPAPAPITGSSTVCAGSSITLSESVAGGSWTSGNLSVAAVDNVTGVVTGIAAGVATISYNAAGCVATKIVTVTTGSSPITGGTSLCIGATLALSDAATGGVWSSSNPAIATVGATGIVTGMATGVVTISYTVSGCSAAHIVSVNSTLSPILGSSTVCTGSSITLSDAVTGGTWTSGNPTLATVNSSTGIVTGNLSGYVTIYYAISGCMTSKMITVNASPAAITGSSSLCAGTVIAMADAIAGGTWSSSNPATAAINMTTGMVSGLVPGVVTIYYTVGSCSVSKTVTVSTALPAIIGSAGMCTGATITLTDAVSGGTWSSSNTAIASAGATTGVVTGNAAGVATIYYTAGGCSVSKTVTVNPAPAVIGGGSILCAGSSIALSDATAGGAWSVSSTAIATISASGILTGVSGGVVTVSYSVGSGCTATKTVTVTAAPAPIAGSSSACIGSATILTDAVLGGTWSSSTTGIATVGSATGAVTGISAGVVTIYYSTGGCTVSRTMTVNHAPSAITGTSSSICIGSTITLADATTGGAWSSSNTAVATAGTAGVITGVATGIATISYSIGSCSVSKTVTVNTAPVAITGSSTVCIGSSITLADATTGGTWIGSNPAVAPVNTTTGNVTGIAAGFIVAYYSVGSCTVYRTVTVNALPAAIAGPSAVCTGAAITLSDATTGGTWSSSNTAAATVGATGVVTGIAGGATLIAYTKGGCSAYKSISVNLCGKIGGMITAGPGKGTDSRVAVAGVKVSIQDAATHAVIAQATTDEQGNYSIDGAGFGRYVVVPEKAGYTASPSAIVTISKEAYLADHVNFTINEGDRTIASVAEKAAITEATGNSINVYPNPSNGDVTITWVHQATGDAVIIVSNVTGSEVYKGLLNISSADGSAHVDLRNLKTGIYMISVKSDNVRYTSKLIIQQ